LRRLPWSSAHVEREKLIAHLSAEQFERLDQLPRDEWPGR
jgi:hypothetical protein